MNSAWSMRKRPADAITTSMKYRAAKTGRRWVMTLDRRHDRDHTEEDRQEGRGDFAVDRFEGRREQPGESPECDDRADRPHRTSGALHQQVEADCWRCTRCRGSLEACLKGWNRLEWGRSGVWMWGCEVPRRAHPCVIGATPTLVPDRHVQNVRPNPDHCNRSGPAA